MPEASAIALTAILLQESPHLVSKQPLFFPDTLHAHEANSVAKYP